LEKSPFLEALGKFRFPWFFERKTDKHLIIQQSGPGRSGTPALVSFLSQVLASFDAARVRLLMVDPIELGASFSAFSAFGDGNKDLITRDTWVTKEDIRRELIALVEHIKTTLTGILRDKSDDLDTYNATPNVIVKPYTFVAIAGFPENFDQECCTFLERILANGPRCGVHVLMTWDRSRPLPHGVTDDSLLRQGILAQVDSTGAIKGIRDAKTNLMKPRFDSRPNAIALTDVVKAASAQAEKNGRVEVHFDKMIARILRGEKVMGDVADFIGTPTGQWTVDSAEGLAVPLGPSGAKSLLPLIFGVEGGLAHNAVIVGAPGTGKSTALHVIIAGLTQMYSPDQVELYLLDFKDGVSFATYAQHLLPHARVVGLKSDAELGLIVLQGVVNQMTERNKSFATAGSGCDNISSYRSITKKAMPRIVLIFDEFQTMLESGTHRKEIAQLLDVVVRKGRNAGIHMILATQTLAGTGIDAISGTLDQVAVRMLLRSSERDSMKLLGSGHAEASRLAKGGSMLFNDGSGAPENTHQLQVAKVDTTNWLPQSIDTLRSRDAAARGVARAPLVFDGEEAADIRYDAIFDAAIMAPAQAVSGQQLVKMWIGSPVSLEPNLAIALNQQSGSNLLVIDRRENLAIGLLTGALLSLLAFQRSERLEIDLVDLSDLDPDRNISRAMTSAFPNRVRVVGLNDTATSAAIGADVQVLLESLANNIVVASSTPRASRKTRILCIWGLQRLRSMRNSSGDGYTGEAPVLSQRDLLSQILRDGPEVGVHCMIWADTHGNADSLLDADYRSQFGLRIVGPMEESPSDRLIGTTDAARFSAVNRSILYSMGAQSPLKTFRPYDLPPLQWVQAYLAKAKKKWEKA